MVHPFHMKITFADVADVLFYSLAVWFSAFGILRYYRLPVWLSLLFSVLFALITGTAVALFLSGKRKKQAVGKRERENRDALLLHLALEKEEKVRAALLTAFLSDGKKAELMEDALSVEGKPLVAKFTMEPLSADAAAVILRRYGELPFTLACKALSPEAEKLLAAFGKEVMNGEEIYALFSRTDTIPSPLICGEIPRKTVKMKLRRSFSKKNAYPFFVSGALLLVMSLFVLFPLYYLISGAALIVCSILVRGFGYA